MTQNFIDKNKVRYFDDQIKSGNFDTSEPKYQIAGYIYDNVYYVTEGHHRMLSALMKWKDSGDYGIVDDLIKYGHWENIRKKPTESYNFCKYL